MTNKAKKSKVKQAQQVKQILPSNIPRNTSQKTQVFLNTLYKNMFTIN
jgi:hypothetical protein